MIRYCIMVDGQLVATADKPDPDMVTRLVSRFGKSHVEVRSIICL